MSVLRVIMELSCFFVLFYSVLFGFKIVRLSRLHRQQLNTKFEYVYQSRFTANVFFNKFNQNMIWQLIVAIVHPCTFILRLKNTITKKFECVVKMFSADENKNCEERSREIKIESWTILKWKYPISILVREYTKPGTYVSKEYQVVVLFYKRLLRANNNISVSPPTL